MTKWEKVKDWWFWTGREYFNFHRFRNFRRGVYNLWVWFPIVWKDRQWDEMYLYQMLEFKFRRMEKFYASKYSWCEDAPIVAKQCQICKNLCERIIRDEYTSPYADEIVAAKDKIAEVEKKFEARFEFLNVDIQATHKSILKAAEHEDMLRRQDIMYLCSMIQKHSLCWWD